MGALFPEGDAPALKTYIMNNVQNASEADPDVLSDYILALLRHDQPIADIMETCVTQLADFLTGDPFPFVKDLFEALTTKAYLGPARNEKKRSFDTAIQPPPTNYQNKVQRPAYSPPQVQQPNQQTTSLQQTSYIPNVITPNPTQGWPGFPTGAFAPWPGQGPPPPGWNSNLHLTMPPPFPIAVPVPVPSPSQWPASPPQQRRANRVKGVCFDYVEKGVCLRGATCPYEHPVTPAVISPTGELEGTDAYDPLHPTTATTPLPVTGAPSISRPTDYSRYEFHKGPIYDKTNTALIVENIPSGSFPHIQANFPENLNESSIRSWFSQFGPLQEVILDPHVRKVTLIYEDHESASKAWNDPRPVFENRFVKIWWKKQDVNSTIVSVNERVRSASGTNAGPSVEELEAAKEAARVAQKEFDEKQRRKVELERKKGDLERQRIELLEKQKREKEKLMEKIRKASEKKAQETSTPKTSAVEANGNGEHKEVDAEEKGEHVEHVNGVEETNGENSRTEKLAKMLADLQSQASALNIPPSEYQLRPLSDSTTRASYRASFRGRGRGFSRGSRGRGGSSRSLDLRPKAILVPDIQETDKETAIREWLVMNCPSATFEPDNSKGLIVKFRERYEAEGFLAKLGVPPLGPLNGSWYVPTTNSENTAAEETPVPVGYGLEKEYSYEEEEEGEVDESEGRWK